MTRPNLRGMSHIDPERGRERALAATSLLDDRLRIVAQPITDLRTDELVAEEIVPLIARSPAPGASPA
ncbi:hypothetical protein ACQ7B2_23120, partial [Escherichia coli]